MLDRNLVLWVVALALSVGLRAQSASPEAEVKACLQAMFDGMRAADSAAVRQVFLPEARLQTAAIDAATGQTKVQSADIGQFCSRLSRTPAGALDERLGHTVILVDGPLATAWTNYYFFLNGALSHCGVNAFQLVRMPEGWRILQVTDTRRRNGCTPESGATDSLNRMVDAWHRAAATADEDAFFGAMTPDGIYIGTDAGERWLRDELRSWAASAFERESAWDFKPSDRFVYFSADGATAWWEEKLDTWMGVCRGSGVARLTPAGWRIAHYHLGVTVPNEKIKPFIALMKQP